MYDNIVEHVQKVKNVALKNRFRATTIVIDQDIAICYGIYPNLYFMGMECQYVEGIKNDLGCNFFLKEKPSVSDVKTIDDYSTQELLDIIKERLEK